MGLVAGAASAVGITMSAGTAAAVAGGVGGLASAAIGSKAAKKASRAQVAAADAAMKNERDIFAQQTALQEPFRQGGLAAQDRLMTLLGLQPRQANAMGRPTSTQPGHNAIHSYDIPGGGQYSIPGWGGDYAQAIPLANATGGVNAMDLGGLQVDPNDPDFGKYARDFGVQDFEEDPGYAFRLSEGQKALDRSAAARGGLQSGGALKAAARFGQQMGSQEYGRAFDRYQINRANQLQPLQSLMGSGQSSANTLGESLGNMGSNISELQLQSGNARASGYMGAANAMVSGIGGVTNAIQQQSYLDQILKSRRKPWDPDPYPNPNFGKVTALPYPAANFYAKG